jgi:hypothetical protein
MSDRDRVRWVNIRSSQTNKRTGQVLFVEHDRVWGPQYLVQVINKEWGDEQFWMRKHEISYI